MPRKIHHRGNLPRNTEVAFQARSVAFFGSKAPVRRQTAHKEENRQFPLACFASGTNLSGCAFDNWEVFMHGVAVMGPGPGYEKHPEHTVELKREGRHIRVLFNGVIIADTRNAITVIEADYDPVAYIPRADVRTDLLMETSRETHCPFKGYASYWSINVEDKTAENAVWGYPRSYAEVSELADYLAFDKRFVDEVLISDD